MSDTKILKGYVDADALTTERQSDGARHFKLFETSSGKDIPATLIFGDAMPMSKVVEMLRELVAISQAGSNSVPKADLQTIIHKYGIPNL